MTYHDLGRTQPFPTRTLTAAPAPPVEVSSRAASPPDRGLRIAVYGCATDEAALFREMAPRFGVDPAVNAAALSLANVELAFGSRCISVDHKTPVDAPILRSLSQAGVRYISTRSIGCNHIDLAAAELAGIRVGNVAYSPDSVADYTLMLMLAVARNVKCTLARAAIRDFRLNARRGRELRDMTVGVIGTGRIGTAVIDRLRGFGCRVVAYDHRPDTTADYVPLDELLQRSDVVTLHTPLNVETYHLLDRERIARMKPGAFVVNTGRGALVDTEALVAALEAGRLGGAAVDVVEGEEGVFYTDCAARPIDNVLLLRLQALDNVVVTPHTAYYTDHAMSDAVEQTIRRILDFESGDQG